MKKTFTLLTLTISLGLFAQEFSGRAVYQTKMNTESIESGESEGASAEDKEFFDQVREAMKKASEKTYVLEFTKNESFYQEEEKLELPTSETSGILVQVQTSIGGKFYKNLKDNYSVMESDIMGETFLIRNDSLHNSEWELSTETKKIGNYTVFKATRMNKRQAAIENEDTEQSGNLLKIINHQPKDLVYTAWYTPEIPISNGPEIYGGLPGLILELHTPFQVFLCSEIAINPKKPIKIQAPKGKTISQKEYEETLKEQSKKTSGKNEQTMRVIEYRGK